MYSQISLSSIERCPLPALLGLVRVRWFGLPYTCSKTVLRRRVLCAVYISTLKTSIKSRGYDISIVMHMLLLLLLLLFLSSILNSFFQDLPSFVRYLQQFSRDLRYYLIRNKSVPAGSVKLS